MKESNKGLLASFASLNLTALTATHAYMMLPGELTYWQNIELINALAIAMIAGLSCIGFFAYALEMADKE